MSDKIFKFKIIDQESEGYRPMCRGCWFHYEDKWWYITKTVKNSEEGYTSVYVKEVSGNGVEPKN